MFQSPADPKFGQKDSSLKLRALQRSVLRQPLPAHAQSLAQNDNLVPKVVTLSFQHSNETHTIKLAIFPFFLLIVQAKLATQAHLSTDINPENTSVYSCIWAGPPVLGIIVTPPPPF